MSDFPEDEGAANNNSDEMNSDYLESEIWKALRNSNQERFQSLLHTIQAGKTILTKKVCNYQSDTGYNVGTRQTMQSQLLKFSNSQLLLCRNNLKARLVACHFLL